MFKDRLRSEILHDELSILIKSVEWSVMTLDILQILAGSSSM